MGKKKLKQIAYNVMQLCAALCCACGKVAYSCCYAARCGSFSRNIKRSKVFLIFFCAVGKKYLD